MSADRKNLEENLYICSEDLSRECTNLVHAKLYSFIACRGEDADKEGFDSTPDGDIAKMISEMGFEKCTTLCIAGQANGCFHRRKQTSTREAHADVEIKGVEPFSERYNILV